MNKARRAAIARAVALINEAQVIIEAARDEEQDYHDAMPDAFRDGDRGEAAQDAANQLDAIYESLDEAATNAGEMI